MLLRFFNRGDLFYEIDVDKATNNQYIIGKEPNSEALSIVINEQSISRKHAVIETINGEVKIKDCNSTNGTYLNNNKLLDEKFHIIKSGDLLHFSSPYFQVVVSGGNKKSHTENKSLSILLQQNNEVFIGRNPDCSIVINSQHVSRKHCLVFKKQNRIFVKDLDSRNGTFINGNRIKGETEITEKDIIFIGTTKISLSSPTSDLRKEVAIQIKGLEKKWDEVKYAFHKINLTIPAASIAGIMGPSGCGKSTILNILTGNILPTKGSISVHGLDFYENYQYLKYYLGYVPQYDIVHKNLTVFESLYYTTRLRTNIKDEKIIEEKIDGILVSLNIFDIKHQSISSISGGEKKRVCIATELINDPLILFLDEPTSPLDPQSGLELLDILVNLTKNGTTIVLVTHKPEDIKYLQNVLFLGKGGFPMYFGTPANHLEYFKEKNTVEIYTTLNSPDSERFKYLHNKFNSLNDSQSPNTIITDDNKIKIKPFNYFSQLFWLIKRCLSIKFNDKINSTILLLQAPIIAFLICIIFEHINLSVLFLLSLSAVWLGVNNAGREIICEVDIYKRERMFNLGISPYIFSKIFVFSLLGLIQNVLFISVINLRYSNGNPQIENVISLAIWFLLLNIVSSVIGLVISSLSKTSEQVISIIPLLLIPQILLAGIIEKINSNFVEFMSYFTVTRWGTEGFANIQPKVFVESPYTKLGLDSALLRNNIPLPTIPFTTEKTSKEILMDSHYNNIYKDVFGSYAGTILLDYIFIGSFFVVLLAIFYWSLKKKDTVL